MRRWLPLLALAALGACQKPATSASTDAPEKAPSEPVEAPGIAAAELVSFEKGTQWVYDLKALQKTAEGDKEGAGEFTMKVEAVAESADGISAEILSTDPLKKTKIKWRLSEAGLVQVAANDLKNKFDPPMPLLPDTLSAGKKIGWKGDGVRLDGTVGPIDVAVTVLGEEEVDTMTGRMKAWSVESAAVWEGKTGQIRALTTSWWSPKVGLVRMIRELDAPEYGLRTELRLKSHTVKQ